MLRRREVTLHSIDFSTANLIFQFIEEAKGRQCGYEFILQSLNIQIIINLLRNVRNNLSNEFSPKEHNDVKVTRVAKEFIQSHIATEFSLNDLASSVNYSPYHFIRIFKKYTGKTPFEYLTFLKIEKAKKLLAANKYSITDISFFCGFKNRTHFSTVFKRMVGVPPSAYRNYF